MSVVVLTQAVACLQAYAKELVHQPLPPGDRWSQGVCGMRRIVPALVVGAANGKFMFLILYLFSILIKTTSAGRGRSFLFPA
jgi:hypothetical protein